MLADRRVLDQFCACPLRECNHSPFFGLQCIDSHGRVGWAAPIWQFGGCMVIKELDPLRGDTAMARAGHTAEEQMAHYLRRAFADDPAVLVINGLRLQHDDDAAQIDHLILHSYGMVIVESKSVTTTLRVNAKGEWTRWYGGRAHGMASPVLQAERQRDFLRGYLRRDSAVLGGKELAINVRVAISDTGVIQRPERAGLDELECVYKADQIPGEIRELIAARKLTSMLPLMLVRLAGGQAGIGKGDALTPGEQDRISSFLVAQHMPLAPREQMAASDTSPKGQGTKDLPQCRKCGSGDLAVEQGYSSYFKCRRCGNNMASASSCPRCGAKEKVRSGNLGIFLDCATCATSRALPGSTVRR
jgi:ribosomal protein L37AE/L43A